MARYIDANKIDFSSIKDVSNRIIAKLIILNQPTADVEEVVRCKDCVHWIYWADCKYCTCDIHHSRNMTRNDFCSYGERTPQKEG